jgi:hypothetical protein
MLEYSLIILSTVLFGGQFIALNAYQGKNGKSYRSILLFCAIFSLTGALVFLSLNGFRLSFSWYTLLYASIAAIIQIGLQIAGIKALALGRVEVYTLFNVAGGMSVAYLFGITYFHEAIKATHIIGLVLVLLALLVPVISDRKAGQKSRIIFWVLCILVFAANGFFGSVNKIHIVSGEGLSIKEYMFYMYASLFIVSAITFSILALIKRDDTTFNIPLSEMKLFLKRETAEKFIDLKTNDLIRIKGTVFSDALGDAWIDVKEITVTQKAPEEKKN